MTLLVEMAPVPPGLLTSMIFLPSTASACGVTARETTSIAPPAPHMMTPVSSRSGKAAEATPATSDRAAAPRIFLYDMDYPPYR